MCKRSIAPFTLSGKNRQFYQDVVNGLSAPNKQLPCKYFYDSKGSDLFSQICELNEYYITRTEIDLLATILPQLRQAIEPQTVVIEPGAGDGIKVELLLSGIAGAAGYLPYDISRSALDGACERIRKRFPRAVVSAVHTEFDDLPKIRSRLERLYGQWNRLVFFPGSTIGNYSPDEAVALLRNFGSLLAPQDQLIVGVDLVKDAAILEAAYDDVNGITAAFNKNLLLRINRELGGDFDPGAFRHVAFFNPVESRIEMHLESMCRQTVQIGDAVFHFQQGERIHTENSYKYAPEQLPALLGRAGFACQNHWQDARNYFAVLLLRKC
jgi:L-histidine N-alpha-methyltransferase